MLDELSKKAQTLTIEERAQLAQELLESVERDADPDVQAAWDCVPLKLMCRMTA
jgi:Putative addiction module component